MESLVSVVVPVYNCEKTISETIESVLAQTYSNWELICVDDGSTDNGETIIEEYCRKDARIRLMKRTRLPKGGSVCRNIGAFEAKGDYLIFLDGDDMLTKDCIENRLKVIENTKLDFAVFPMASFSDDPAQAKKCSRTDVKNMKYYFASAQGGWQVTSPIFRSEFFRLLNGFNESFPRLQDLELHFRAIIASKGNYIVKDEAKPDCLYRMSENHYSAQKIINGLNAHKLFFQLLKDNIAKLDQCSNRSTAILCNFCNLFVELYLLERQNQKTLTIDEVVDLSFITYLTPFHETLYNFFSKNYHHKACFYIVKVIRKLLLQKFIMFS